MRSSVAKLQGLNGEPKVSQLHDRLKIEGKDMKSDICSDNGFVCVINEDHEIQYFNEYVQNTYPDVKCGNLCYETFMGHSEPCLQCPLYNGNSDEIMVYHSLINKWMNMKAGKIPWPNCGEAFVLLGSEAREINRSIWHRLPHMGDYDVFFELNLTKNQYKKILTNTKAVEYVSEKNNISDLIEMTAKTLVHEDDRENFLAFWDCSTMIDRIHEAGHVLQANFREKNKDGDWDLVRAVLVPENRTDTTDELVMAMFMVLNSKDTELEEQSDSKKTESESSPVTGLSMGLEYQKKVQEYVSGSRQKCCMMVLDVEHFRFFNKWYGRARGDRLLKMIGDYLNRFDENYGSCSGYCGGDNFCIVFEYQKRLVDILWNELSELVSHFEGITGFGIVAGGYMIPEETYSFRDMYDCATTAMGRMVGKYQKEIFWYGDEMVSDLEKELRMLPEIERGLAEEEFIFYLQMKYSLVKKRVVGAEALLRWQHKERGLVMPGQFIPLCEKNGMITKLDQYLWEAVCKSVRRWLDEGYHPVPISVNVSRRDFYEIDVPEYFAMLTEKYQIDPKYIEIEITESAFVENAAILQKAEAQFHEKGFTVLIDDFGSGYSSLNMLKDIQADVLKMDVKFLDLNERNETKGKEIVKSIFDMASALQYTVVAEGVETEEQLKTLKSIGCEYVQGYYFYRPMPVEQYEEQLLKVDHKTI